MATDPQTCTLIKDLLSSPHTDPEAPGRELLETRLRLYLYWKKRLVESDDSVRPKQPSKSQPTDTQNSNTQISDALKKKDAGRAFANKNRRRVRGGASGVTASQRSAKHEDAESLETDTLAEM